MKISDHAYRRLRRLQLLTGVVPLGIFLISHLAINSLAIGGPGAYQPRVEAIGRLPWLNALELIAIALPIAIHIGLGVLLAMARQSAMESAWPDERWRWMQRVTGAYLSIYVVFHVWAIRFSPERLAHRKPLFDLMAAQLAHPLVWTLQAIAVVAAAAHFSGGLVALTGPAGWPLGPSGQRAARWSAVLIGAALAGMGVASLAAFVWPSTRWLAPRS